MQVFLIVFSTGSSKPSGLFMLLSDLPRTRDGHVRFWKVPAVVPTLCHLCRSTLRLSVSTHQMEAMPIPRRILEYLTYRNIPALLQTPCSPEDDWGS